ncbi:MAG: acyltransferase [Gammaproteobacteria bacterium]|nr:acyltransferase [Gammaproteobacteria bacterium]MDH5628732.1 acyltransferase [Gammaproteobacteria bacterium]
MTPKYRSDIDGLRAIAVLSVVFFHSGLSIFSGGYVGVDVFFVISGYLITTIIVREIQDDNFSISRFYERRFRRILPALTVMVFFTLIFGSILLSPKSVIDLGQSAISTALFVSNLLFYSEAGYFDTAAELKPLLHTWSLAIEEQYYIFFPWLLILIAKVDTRHYLRWILSLTLLSLIASIFLTESNPSGAFYWLHTRAWELFVGSLLAINAIPAPKSKTIREINSIIGLAMILYSIFAFTGDTAFPGYAAILPVLGTALIIHAGSGGQSVVYRLLSIKPMVFVGLISYSLYLWHWPVIVYTKVITIHEPSHIVMAMMIGLTFVLSILSWKFVETPFRKKQLFKEKRPLLKAAGWTTGILFICGAALIANRGYPDRVARITSQPFDIKDAQWEHWDDCEGVVKRIKNNESLCDMGVENRETSFILWGDSHARAIASSVDFSAKNLNVSGKIATQSACPPLLLLERPDKPRCVQFNQTVLEFIADNNEITTVILAARWSLAVNGDRFKHESGIPISYIDTGNQDVEQTNAQMVEAGFIRTINALKQLGKKVVIVNQVPEVGYDVPTVFMISGLTDRDANHLISPTVNEYHQRIEKMNPIYDQIKSIMPITFVEPASYLCNEQYCQVVLDGMPLYRDDDHLSTFGSEHIADMFNDVLSGKQQKESIKDSSSNPDN